MLVAPSTRIGSVLVAVGPVPARNARFAGTRVRGCLMKGGQAVGETRADQIVSSKSLVSGVLEDHLIEIPASPLICSGSNCPVDFRSPYPDFIGLDTNLFQFLPNLDVLLSSIVQPHPALLARDTQSAKIRSDRHRSRPLHWFLLPRSLLERD